MKSLFFIIFLLLPVFSGSATEVEPTNFIYERTGGKINCVGAKKLLQIRDHLVDKNIRAILPYVMLLLPHT